MHRHSDHPSTEWADIAVLLAAWLIVLAAFAAAAHCQSTPSLEGVEKYGYVIEQVARARYQSAVIVEGFEGTVWVRYKDSQPEWRFTLTFRPKRSDAVRDCEAWMDRVEKTLKQHSKPSR